jgi:hypothetical protein
MEKSTQHTVGDQSRMQIPTSWDVHAGTKGKADAIAQFEGLLA